MVHTFQLLIHATKIHETSGNNISLLGVRYIYINLVIFSLPPATTYNCYISHTTGSALRMLYNTIATKD